MRTTTVRVLRQLRHDPRTLVLLIVVPAVLMTLLRYVFDSNDRVRSALRRICSGSSRSC